MSLLLIPIQSDGDSSPSGVPKRRWGSRWLALARVGWVSITGLCLAHSLHPLELELLGLCQALRERVLQYQQTDEGGLYVHMESPQSLPSLPIAVETATYYIALEALNNVQRHAQAQHCSLRLALVDSDDTLKHLPGVWNASVLELEICDDGCGLSEEAQQKGTGLGFISMHERAAELGGTCLIEHIVTGGTRVYVRLPYMQATDV